jgi:hypothetical protein
VIEEAVKAAIEQASMEQAAIDLAAMWSRWR